VNHPLNPQEFISGGWDGEIHIWDARRPHSVRRIEVRINPLEIPGREFQNLF